MTPDTLFVFGLLFVTVALFVSDRVRLDLVAIMVMVALALSGVLTPAQAVSGFGQPVVLMIAGLFVVGDGLFRTGVAAAVGNWLLKMGGDSEQRLLLFLLPAVAGLSAFMSSTGAVAVFIPVVLSLCRKAGISPSRLLMPLAFGSLIGGMLTLIGTPPNLVVSTHLEKAGHAPFGFFDFTPIGFAVLVFGMLYLVVFGRRLLPGDTGTGVGTVHPPFSEIARRYGIDRPLQRVLIGDGSSLVGKTVVEAGLRTHHQVTVVGLRRKGRLLENVLPVLTDTVLHAHDELFVVGDSRAIDHLCTEGRLTHLEFPPGEVRKMRKEFGVAEILIPPRSHLIGQTIQQGSFRQRFGLSAIGVRRDGEPIEAAYNRTRLAFGDTVLVAGAWPSLERLQSEHRELIVTETPAEMEEVPSHAHRASVALAVAGGMLFLMSTGVPALTAVLLAALGMVVTGCVRMDEVYRSMGWSSLVLIAGMLPLALALEQTGGVTLIVDALTGWLGAYGPVILCAGLFLLTSLFSQFISNTATTVLVAPIAVAAAGGMGLSPEPFMMTVAIAASTSFATPMASPVNTLVLAPGGYRFRDFVKVGVPLQMMAMVITLLLVPMLFPF